MKLSKGESPEGLLSGKAGGRKEGASFSPPDQSHHQSVKNFGQTIESNTVNADTEGLSFTSENNNLYPTDTSGGVLVTYFLHALEIERLLQVNRSITHEASQLEKDLASCEHRQAQLQHQAGLRSAQFEAARREAEEKDQVIFELSEKVKELEELLHTETCRPQSLGFSTAQENHRDKELQSLRRKNFELEAFVKSILEERDQREQELVGLLKSREEEIQTLVDQKTAANITPQSASNSFVDGVAASGFDYTPVYPPHLYSAEVLQTVESIDERDSSFIYREDSQQLLQHLPSDLKYTPAVARPTPTPQPERPRPSASDMLRFLFPSKLSKTDLRLSVHPEASKPATGSLRSQYRPSAAVNMQRHIFDTTDRSGKPAMDPSLLEGVSVQTDQPTSSKFLMSSKSRQSEKARRAKQPRNSSEAEEEGEHASFKFQSLNISDVSKKYIQKLGLNGFIAKSKLPATPQQTGLTPAHGRSDLKSLKQTRELQRGSSNPSQLHTSAADSFYTSHDYPKEHSATKSSTRLSKHSPQLLAPPINGSTHASAIKNYEQQREVVMKKAAGPKGGPTWLSNFSSLPKKPASVTKYS